jgi:hypothetical protein
MHRLVSTLTNRATGSSPGSLRRTGPRGRCLGSNSLSPFNRSRRTDPWPMVRTNPRRKTVYALTQTRNITQRLTTRERSLYSAPLRFERACERANLCGGRRGFASPQHSLPAGVRSIVQSTTPVKDGTPAAKILSQAMLTHLLAP